MNPSRDLPRPDNPKNPKKSRPPDKPPDDDRQRGSSRPSPSPPPQSSLHVPSYQEKLLGKLAQQQASPKAAPVDLLASKVMSLSYRHNDPLCPEFAIDPLFKQQLQTPWQQAIIVKVLGRTVGYKVLYSRIHQLWKPKGELDVLALGNDFFLVQFSMEDDRNHAINNGPWMIQGHYLTVRQWSPDFRPSTSTMDKILAWVRFPELPVMYYDDNVLRVLASGVGFPFRVDVHTSLATRGQFARVCVEIDLAKPLVGKIWFDGFCYPVVYEGLDTICYRCGIYGHVQTSCPSTPPPDASSQPTSFTTDGGAGVQPLAPTPVVADQPSDMIVPDPRYGHGLTTILVAELRALHYGLAFARTFPRDGLLIESDSMEALRCLSLPSDALAFHPQAHLIADIRSLLDRTSSYTLTHVLHEGNRCADFLAHLGSTGAPVERLWLTPPPGLSHHLRTDAQGVLFNR
ncbi:hypothetical protein K2173_008225 [Erythroxylum novogranatense]|uniref:CCHC-type domain-containing protein n=1 Tax=Erythroxylum novogranatense TaxID=1862640 RepID=A0AAV8TUS5_9ROSI|nr:hypothetical protein K2173_008225 [Erythroxylum novogranatense]